MREPLVNLDHLLVRSDHLPTERALKPVVVDRRERCAENL
jgi:hypothetical protein